MFGVLCEFCPWLLEHARETCTITKNVRYLGTIPGTPICARFGIGELKAPGCDTSVGYAKLSLEYQNVGFDELLAIAESLALQIIPTWDFWFAPTIMGYEQ